jgi:hypothetical protein
MFTPSPEAQQPFSLQHLGRVRGKQILIAHLLDGFEPPLVTPFQFWVCVSIIVHSRYFFPVPFSLLLRASPFFVSCSKERHSTVPSGCIATREGMLRYSF